MYQVDMQLSNIHSLHPPRWVFETAGKEDQCLSIQWKQCVSEAVTWLGSLVRGESTEEPWRRLRSLGGAVFVRQFNCIQTSVAALVYVQTLVGTPAFVLI